jgi:hypothetical protein
MAKYPDTAPLPIVFSRFWGYGRWSHFWYVFEWRVLVEKEERSTDGTDHATPPTHGDSGQEEPSPSNDKHTPRNHK